MKHLNQFVICKIAPNWEKVAYSLEFDIPRVILLEKKYQKDHVGACSEMMREWLSSDVGLTPKSWSTLIAALKETVELTAAVEEIEQDIKCISFIKSS